MNTKVRSEERVLASSSVLSRDENLHHDGKLVCVAHLLPSPRAKAHHNDVGFIERFKGASERIIRLTVLPKLLSILNDMK